jgi:hypothetical protein
VTPQGRFQYGNSEERGDSIAGDESHPRLVAIR